MKKKKELKRSSGGETWHYSPMARAPTKEAMRAFSPLFTSVPSPTTAASDMVKSGQFKLADSNKMGGKLEVRMLCKNLIIFRALSKLSWAEN